MKTVTGLSRARSYTPPLAVVYYENLEENILDSLSIPNIDEEDLDW